MEVLAQTEKLCCPRCGGTEISKSRRRGVMERYLNDILQLRPYRCYECSMRFWKRRSSHAAQSAEVRMDAPQSSV